MLCPRCQIREYTPYGQPYEHGMSPPFAALSRVDNQTYICSECGTAEAMRDIAGAPPIPPDEWPVKGGE